MTRIELKQILEDLNISKSMYSLEGGLPSEKYVLNKNEEEWEVYYSERGSKNLLGVFYSENEACIYLLAKLKNVY